MKILLDESSPHILRHWLWEHDVQTVVFRKWGGIRNGELLRRAAGEYELLITADQSIPHQQQIAGLPIALLVLPTNDWKVLKGRLDDLRRAIAACAPGRVEWMP